VITEKAEDFTSAKPILDLPGYSLARQEEDYRWAVHRFYEGRTMAIMEKQIATNADL
jgi:hypothetical protein